MTLPAETFSPGEYLAEMLQGHGMTELDLANRIGRPLAWVHWLINHDGLSSTITQVEAEAFAAIFGTSAELWLNLQSAHFEAVCRELAEEACDEH